MWFVMDGISLYKMSMEERKKTISKVLGLSIEDLKLLENSLPIETADKMIENVIGKFELPYGVATNFKVDGKDILVPMVTEEPSIIAAASYGAKLAKPEGFSTSADKAIMKSMVQLVGIDDIMEAKKSVMERKHDLIKQCRDPDSSLVKIGGGVFDIVPRVIETKRGKMLVVDIFCDCKDAMGANTVNTAAEKLAPFLEDITGGKRRLMIVSNLPDKRLVRAEAVWKRDVIGEDIIEGILDAYEFAECDIYRCSTQNKGIMNGIDAVCLATGNDFRAVEAGAHSYAASKGYCSLTKYEKTREGDLSGSIELPLAVGIIGGATKTHPLAQLSLKIMGVKKAEELARIMASVGLAQNFASLRAQVSEGIQKGHMKLHAKNIAVNAGAKGDDIDRVAKIMAEENKISVSRAKDILDNRRSE